MRTMKKILAAGLTAVMAMSLMVGCGSKKDDSSSKTYNLGIIQFAEHGSLDNCRKGFLKGLESEGIKEGENLKITYKNSQADTATDNQIASNSSMMSAPFSQTSRIEAIDNPGPL